jgi:hypothetical protein
MKMNQKFFFLSAIFYIFGCITFYCYARQHKHKISRDPFYLNELATAKKTQKKHVKKNHRSKQIVLEGVIAIEGHLAAVLHDGLESEVAVLGDCVWGYTVDYIDNNKVALKYGRKTKEFILE